MPLYVLEGKAALRLPTEMRAKSGRRRTLSPMALAASKMLTKVSFGGSSSVSSWTDLNLL
jgi:hypothetical protein